MFTNTPTCYGIFKEPFSSPFKYATMFFMSAMILSGLLRNPINVAVICWIIYVVSE